MSEAGAAAVRPPIAVTPYPIDSQDAETLRSAFQAHRADIALWNNFYTAQGVKNAADYVELQCKTFANSPAVEFVGSDELFARPLLYSELHTLSNRMASYFLLQQLNEKGTVCLMMENSPLFLITWMALSKIGVTVALLNTGLKEKQLRHSVNISLGHTAIISETYKHIWNQTLELYAADGVEPPKTYWSQGAKVAFTPILQYSSSNNGAAAASQAIPLTYVEESLTTPTHVADSSRDYREFRTKVHWESPLFLIYTSGTTGPSKAAIFSHRRFMGAGITWTLPMALSAKDKYYICLPLYHGNGGVVAVSACMHIGCVMVIRGKFSTSNFWKDVRKHGCTAMIYVGELWRYLHNAAPSPEDVQNPMRVIAGNGLRADIWESVRSRFGIERVVEHYGMTEMPAGPYMNFYGRPGCCGFVPPEVRQKQGADKLIRFDVDSGKIVRDEKGRAVEVPPGEVGECVFLLAPGVSGSQAENPHTEGGAVDATTGVSDALGNPLYKPYRNYTDVAACERRVYRHCFEELDAWFATGDLLRLDAEGFFSFVDRIGDTFRWKGENVATNDVAEVLCAHPNVLEANVYGVEWKGQDGRAGMASIVWGVKDETISKDGSSTAASSSSSSDSIASVEVPPFDESGLITFLYDRLPSFAIPAFLRVRGVGLENNKTSTLKFQKTVYQAEGFDPAKCEGDTLYFWPNAKLGKQQQQAAKEAGVQQAYVKITADMYGEINGGASA